MSFQACLQYLTIEASQGRGNVYFPKGVTLYTAARPVVTSKSPCHDNYIISIRASHAQYVHDDPVACRRHVTFMGRQCCQNCPKGFSCLLQMSKSSKSLTSYQPSVATWNGFTLNARRQHAHLCRYRAGHNDATVIHAEGSSASCATGCCKRANSSASADLEQQAATRP